MKHYLFLSSIALMTCLSCSTKQKVTVEYKDYRPLNLSSFVTLQNNIMLDMPEEGRRIRDFHIGRLIVAKERIYAIDEKGDKIVIQRQRKVSQIHRKRGRKDLRQLLLHTGCRFRRPIAKALRMQQLALSDHGVRPQSECGKKRSPWLFLCSK